MKHMECICMKNVMLNIQLYIYRALFICHIIYIRKNKREEENSKLVRRLQCYYDL